MSNTTINCQDCKGQWEVPDEDVPLGIQDDDLVVTKGTYGSIRYFGICETCRFGYKKKQVVDEDPTHRLLRIRDRVRVLYPEWSIERVCAHAAELMNDPREEPNIAYRVYLLEWIPREEAA